MCNQSHTRNSAQVIEHESMYESINLSENIDSETESTQEKNTVHVWNYLYLCSLLH